MPERKSPTSEKSPSVRRRSPLAIVVLAAGQGKRMRSRTAKVLHQVAGRSLIAHVMGAVEPLGADSCVVVTGYDAEGVSQEVGARARSVVQREQLGTGHAVMQSHGTLSGFDGDVLVLCGDVPLITTKSLRALLRRHSRSGALATVLGMVLDDPGGYGRILDEGRGRIRIVEDADAVGADRDVDEVNTGIYVFESGFLFRSLSRLDRSNVQGEYYLTDLMEAASRQSRAGCSLLEDETEGLGVNSRFDLAQAEAVMQERLILKWMEKGVTFLDPSTVYLSCEARLGRDCVIGPNVRLDGATSVGADCVIDGSTYLRDTTVGAKVHVKWGVVADRAKIASRVKLGPYSHLRPEAELGSEVHVGNFVEIKKSRLGRGTKANHLSYIGDATVGSGVNVGAGTITCNYDGFTKSRTTIGDRVQIGSDTQLVAPVSLGNDSYVAAGSTVNKDVEAGALVFNDKKQQIRKGWVKDFRRRARNKRGG
ncbi:MAG: bifunctional UDP-N-acetylglucosamine diphosphorylase/glucosamine-1-phosphate N-acetyltransferase GlmU [Candidatus Binatia bacterium]